jgi:hypothetical protein
LNTLPHRATVTDPLIVVRGDLVIWKVVGRRGSGVMDLQKDSILLFSRIGSVVLIGSQPPHGGDRHVNRLAFPICRTRLATYD